jgi:hypothetical protein
MMSKIGPRIALGVTLLVGVFWSLGELLIALWAGGWHFTSLRIAVLSIFGLGLMFAAPICLIVSSLLGLLGKAPFFSFICCAVSSLWFCVVLGQSVYVEFHRNLAEASMGIILWILYVAAAVLCVWSTVWMGIFWKRSRHNYGV